MKRIKHFLGYVLGTMVPVLLEGAAFFTIRDAAQLSGLALAALAVVFVLIILATVGFAALLYWADANPVPEPDNGSEPRQKPTNIDISPRAQAAYRELVKEQQAKNLIDSFSTKVKGVTFDNDDGSSRQDILSNCYAGMHVDIRRYSFMGRPAFGVYTCYGMIGNIPADIAESFDHTYGRNAYMVGKIGEIRGGFDGLSYGCVLDIDVWRGARK